MMTTGIDRRELSSMRQLWRATALAALIAGMLLITIILPSEYGLDPTGVGRRLGVFRQASDAAIEIPAADALEGPPSGAALRKSSAAFRTDETSVVLRSGEGSERKAVMAAGQSMVFSWTSSGGGVDADMHGETGGTAGGEFTSYWKEEGQESGHGSFTAPKGGTHGWFWQNLNDTAVTITLRTSGYYEQIITP